MKTTFALLLMTTAISAATGALAAVPPLVTGPVGVPMNVVANPAAAPAADMTQVSDDAEADSWFWPAGNGGGSDDGNGGGSSSGGGNDDECEDDDAGDAACGLRGTGNAAPAGQVAPPSNGLFTKGTAPKVTTN